MRDRLRAVQAVLEYSFQADPRRTIAVVVIQVVAAANITLTALWVKLLTDGARTAANYEVLAGSIGLAVVVCVDLLLQSGSVRVAMVLREKTVQRMESDLLSAVARSPGLELQENHAHLTQLELWQAESWQFSQALAALVTLLFFAARIIFAALLLYSVSPVLLLLPVFGLPSLLLSGKTSGLYLRGGELAAEPTRRAHALFGLATQAGPAKELRAFCLESEVLQRFHQAHVEIQSIHRALQMRAQFLSVLPRTVFAAGYALSIAYVAGLAAIGRASVGDVLLIAVLATQVLNWVTQSAETMQFTLRTLAAVNRFLYLLDAARPPRDRRIASAAPLQIRRGIQLSGVSFRYDGQSEDVLSDLELDLPAGSTVALVGANGAGKTTLVKLLAGYYQPTAGRIVVDDLDLQAIEVEGWRERVSGVFQDYARMELVARESVGVGHLPDLDHPEAARHALERADAEYLIERWPSGLETQLGPTFPDGVDLSGGEWQKVAVARGMMRTAPLLLVLDEPSAALDPESEQELFERYASAARRVTADNGGITLLVSHRFSTVRIADTIAVMDGGHVIEYGTHAQLMAQHGHYAELFALQARAYA